MALVTCHRDDAILSQSPNISEFKDEWVDLQREIDHYNTIIEWDDMWDTETAKKWFKKGHRLFLFKQEDKIQGWVWVFTTKEFRHLYVNPQYRNLKNDDINFNSELVDILKQRVKLNIKLKIGSNVAIIRYVFPNIFHNAFFL